ncbi:MAG: DNA primase [Gammaproteobacteria bacterium]
MAGRIPQRFIDELLERVDIVDVIDSRVPLRKAGKNYSARCPFHDEKSPSFNVNPDRQFYYCFGCGAGGNAIGFVMEFERLEFPAAVEKLAALAGLEIPREDGGPPTGASTRQAELLKRLDSAAGWFRRQLREHPQAGVARDYLERRGLSPATIEAFGIGSAPPGWEGMLRALAPNEAERKLLLDAGLLIRRDDGSLYDRFRERVMFPILDNRGRTVAFCGRVLTDEKPKYLNSPETAVFHKGQELYGLYQARRSQKELERVLVVEGYMDVVMLAQHGIPWATGTLGTSLSASHLQRLYRYTSEVVFCFDGDAAGRRAADRALEIALPAMQDGRQAAFLFLPEGEDPDSLVQKIGSEAFRAKVAAAIPLSEYLFEHHGAGVDLSHPDGRARLSKLLLPAIGRIPGTVFRELLRGMLAERIGVAVDRLPEASPGTGARQTQASSPPGEALQPVAQRPAPPPMRQALRPSGHRRVPGSARGAVRLLLQNPGLAREAGDTSVIEGGDDPDLPLLLQVLGYLQKNPGASLGALLGYWYGSPEGELLGRLAAEESPPGADPAAEFSDTLAHLAARVADARWDLRRRELEATPFAEMSPAQKQEYLALLGGRGRF